MHDALLLAFSNIWDDWKGRLFSLNLGNQELVHAEKRLAICSSIQSKAIGVLRVVPFFHSKQKIMKLHLPPPPLLSFYIFGWKKKKKRKKDRKDRKNAL